MKVKWKYTHVSHGPRRSLGIDCNEYAVFDLIYKSQTHPDHGVKGYTDQPYKQIAEFLGMGVGTVYGTVKRGIEWGLVAIHPSDKRLKRMTSNWYDVVDKDKIADEDIVNVRQEAARRRAAAEEEEDHDDDDFEDADVVEEDDVQNVNFDSVVQNVNDDVQNLNEKRSDSERKRSDSELHLYIKETKEETEVKKEGASLVSRACEVIDFFNLHLDRKTKTHLKGKPVKAVDWIIKHLKNDFTVQEMTWAIMLKSMEWKDNPKMAQHLKLVTLFKNRGSQYIEEAIEASEDPKLQSIIKAAAAAESNSNSKAGIVAGDVTSKMAQRLSRRSS